MAYSPVHCSIFDSSKNFPALAALLLAGAALLAGCHPSAVTDPKDPKFVVAEKGNWQITSGELDKEIASLLKQHQATPEQVGPEKMLELKSSMLKNMVLKNLLLAKGATLQLENADKDEAAELEGIKSRVPPGQDFEQQLKLIGLTLDDVKKQIHEKVVIEKVLKAEAFKNDDPTDQEINDFYLKKKADITAPPQVRASRILVHVDEKISKVAMQVSEDRTSAPKGGDIDYFRPGENPDAGFDQVAFNTKLGAVSPVFETSLGYQFLKVTDIKPGGEVPLAEVRPKIAAYLREMKMQEQEKAYVTALLANSDVAYHITLVEPTPQTAAGPGGPDSAPPAAAPAPPAATNSAPAK
jgi:hypothetical protein